MHQYDVTLNVSLSKERMEYALWYYEHSIPREQVVDLAGAFEAALLGAVRSSNTHVQDIGLAGEGHLRWLYKRNEALPEASKECIHDAIAPFLRDTPHAPAVCAWDGNFTYEELGHLASLLAQILIQKGIRGETFVAIHLEKSRWTPVVMLAVLLAGGAFTLLDPSLPLAHKQVICDDVACRVLVASEVIGSGLPSVQDVIPIGDGQEQSWATTATATPADEKSNPSQPCQLAYAVFTSGSTGKPKGVLIEHESFCTSARSQHRHLSIDNSTRVLQFSAYSWDVSIMDQLGTLMAGGCICIPSEGERVNGLAGAIQRYSATWIQTTPPVVRLLQPDQVPSLRTVVLIGETPSYDDMKTWRGRVSLRETYGPTECSVLATVNPDLAGDPRNIGRESACLCWIVDASDHNRLLPVGAIGELLIEGPILGRGYLNDTALTSSVFVDSPSWATALRRRRPVRLYKTGDLAHYCYDGSLRYVRRKDAQIKLRGQRIEPGEIEHHISSSFEGAERVLVDVITPGAEPSLAVLAAFVKERESDSTGASAEVADVLAVPNTEFAAKAARCQTQLSGRLPKHMVPTVFLPLAWVPLTSTCKTDRRRLRRRAADLTRDGLASYFASASSKKQAPQNETERVLRDAWSRVLGTPPDAIGVHDSFFHLGGDSMSAMRLIADCRAIGLTISMQAIFQHRTIQQLALHCVAASHGAHEGPGHAGEPFPLSPAQHLWLDSCLSDCASHPYRSFVVETRQPYVDADWLRRAVGVLVERHAMLRARFEPDSHGVWQQRITADIESSYHLRYTQPSEGCELDLNPVPEPRSFNIRRGPLLDVCMVAARPREGDHGARVAFFCHSLVADALSCRILASDMMAMIENATFASLLAPVPASFQKWCGSLTRNDVSVSTSPTHEHLREHKQRDGANSDSAVSLGDTEDCVAGDLEHVSREVRLDAQVSRLIWGAANCAFATQPVEIFHSALLHSFFQAFGPCEPPRIRIEDDGRAFGDGSLDFSHTVGCFTTLPAVHLEAGHRHELVDLVYLVKDARRLARKSQDGSDPSPAPSPGVPSSALEHDEIVLRCEPLDNQGLEFTEKTALSWPPSRANTHQLSTTRASVVEVFCYTDRGEIVVSFNYDRRLEKDGSLARWADKYRESLGRAASELVSRPPVYTLGDFPLLQFTYEGLGRFVAEVEGQAKLQGINGGAVIDDAYPCSPIQRGILLSQSKDANLYRPRFTWRLHSTGAAAIELSRLRKAWETVLQRHGIFRTVFVPSPGQPGFYSQAVLRATPDNITELTCEEEDDIPSLIRRHREASDARSRHALWHLLICQTSKGETFCDLQVNHALIDGTSIALLSSEVQRAYAGQGSVDAGPRYRDYIEYLQSSPVDKTVAYWKAKLSGISPSLFPRVSGPRENAAAEHGERVLRSVDVSIAEASPIHQFCAEHELTVSNVVYVAWALVLRSYVQSDESIFAYTTSGRDVPLSGIDEAIGPFINTLVCRVPLPAKAVLLEVLRTVRDGTVEGLNYQNCSLAEIGHALAVDTAELFNSSISVQDSNPRKSAADLPVVLVSEEGADPTEYALSIHALVDKESISLSVNYWEDECLSSDQAERLVHTLREAITTIVSRPQATVSQASLLSANDWDLISRLNQNSPPRYDVCVHHLIEQHFRDRPSSTAVHAWDGDLTYGALDRLSGKLAAYLVQNGARPETFIPLVFEKSLWTVVAMVGVMRAGAAFVLMDPATPVRRLEDICVDTQPALVLASVTHQDVLQHLSVQIIVVGPASETTWPDLPLPAVDVQPSNVVYAVFTSGSTGKPKGVITEHASCCSTLEMNKGPKGIDANSRTFQFSAYSFDLSISDHLLPLTQGGCVCIPSASQLQDLEKAIATMGANWADLTPSVARLINPSRVPSLRTVNLCGEAMAEADKAQWQGFAWLVHTYGPAECGQWCMAQPDVAARTGPPDIGFGTGAVCWLVDPADHNTLVPVGATGEILIEGPAVSRGYLHRPEQTDATFVSPPLWLQRFRPASSRRLYKTGDLARYQADGTMLCLGRKDTQVKLRGQRLELDEVAFHVRQCLPPNHDVVADLIRPEAGRAKPMLAAFIHAPSDVDARDPGDAVVLPSTATFQRTALLVQTHLRETLPRFMVPTAFLPLARVPLRATGKLDRKLLQATASRMSLDEVQAYVAPVASGDPARPANEVETLLRECIAHVLNRSVGDVGLNDNFFFLGGDSIGAMALVTRCRHEGMAVTIPDIFRYKTIRRMAPRVQKAHASVPAFKEKLMTPFALSPIQQAFFDRVPEGLLRYNQSFMVKLRQPLEHVEKCIATIVERHSMLRARFLREGNAWVQLVTDEILQSFRFRQANITVEGLKEHLDGSQAAIDCQEGPLIVVDQLQIDDNQYLSFITHHLVVDLVSWRVILADLEILLGGGSLPPKHCLPYQGWCQAQSEHIATRVQPQDTLPLLDTVGDFEVDVEGFWGCTQSANTNAGAVSASVELDAATAALLLGNANEALQTKPVELLHAAVLLSFVQTFSDRRPPVIHQEGHGREPWDSSIDVSETVGWFTTVFPVLAAATTDSSLVNVVRRIKDTLRATPGNGARYFASRYLHPEGSDILNLKTPTEILLNYHGAYHSLEREHSILQTTSGLESVASSVDPRMPRDAFFVIEAWVAGGVMKLELTYNEQFRHQEGIRAWLATCKKVLQSVTEELPKAPRQLTLSDVPRLRLAQSELDKFMSHLAHLGISPSSIQDAYPCSHLQQGILLSQGRDGALYRTKTTWKMACTNSRRALTVDVIAAAWDNVVAKFSTLRTIIIDGPSDRLYDQVVVEGHTGEVTVTDSSGTRKVKRGPLPWTFEITQVSNSELVCALTISHALVDGRSLQLLGTELLGAVNSHDGGPESLPYGEYVAYLEGVSPERIDDYWNTYLGGATSTLFPKLNAAPQGRQHAETRQLPARRLQRFSEMYGTTLSNVIQVAWALVLSGYTGADDVSFGYPASGRDIALPGVEGAVGLLVNLLVCRLQLDDDAPLAAVLQSNEDAFVRSLEHQHCSVARIQHNLGFRHEPLFNSIISYQARSSAGAEAADGGEGGALATLQTLDLDDPTEVSYCQHGHFHMGLI